MSRADFDTGIELEEGVIVGFETPEGEELAGAILSIDEDTVNVDFNHPMAGHTIIFDVEIIDVVPTDGDD
jgi:FKBP-type peptidyl-prolyl cis-trans isomerase SlpA